MQKLLLDHPWIVVIVLIWTLPWKGAALWKSARRGHMGWFLTLLIINSLAILDILYIFIFANLGKEKGENNKKQEKGKREESDSHMRFSLDSKKRTIIV